MHLTLYEYSQLTLTDRLQLLWEHGTFLHNVAAYSHGFKLYSIFGFYVEVVVSYGEVVKITDAVPLVRGHRLNKYLACIDLNDLTDN